MERDFKAFLMSQEFYDIEEFYSISRNNNIKFKDDKTTFIVKYFIRETKYQKKYTMDKHFNKILACANKKFYNDINHIITPPSTPISLPNHPEIIQDIYEKYQNNHSSHNMTEKQEIHDHTINISDLNTKIDIDKTPDYCHKLVILKNGLPIPYVCKMSNNSDHINDISNEEEELFFSADEDSSDNECSADDESYTEYA